MGSEKDITEYKLKELIYNIYPGYRNHYTREGRHVNVAVYKCSDVTGVFQIVKLINITVNDQILRAEYFLLLTAKYSVLYCIVM